MSCKFYIFTHSVLKVIIPGTDWVSLFVLFAHNHSMADYIIDWFGLILFERCCLLLPLFLSLSLTLCAICCSNFFLSTLHFYDLLYWRIEWEKNDCVCLGEDSCSSLSLWDLPHDSCIRRNGVLTITIVLTHYELCVVSGKKSETELKKLFKASGVCVLSCNFISG